MSEIDDLLAIIFNGRPSAFAAEFESWIRNSRRFKAFATQYRAKIRAKLKNARDESGLGDVRAELATAALLLSDPRFALEYETYAASKQRGPDFTATFRTRTSFNIEVRRIRGRELDSETDSKVRSLKLMTILRDKVGQMPPGKVNLLWLHSEHKLQVEGAGDAATKLRLMAERKDNDFFVDRGFANASVFLKQYRLLSGIVVRWHNEQALWLNSVARHPLPSEIATAIQRLPAT